MFGIISYKDLEYWDQIHGTRVKKNYFSRGWGRGNQMKVVKRYKRL